VIAGYALSKEIFRDRKRALYSGYRQADDKPVLIKTLPTEIPSSTDLANLKDGPAGGVSS
jgi:hypothetical protein